MLIEEVSSKWPCITEALESAVHEAGVAKVCQTYDASLSIWVSIHLHSLRIYNQICLTLVKVVLLIVSLASLRAILNFLADAGNLEERSLIATLALAVLSRVFVIFENEGAPVSFYFYNNEVGEEAESV